MVNSALPSTDPSTNGEDDRDFSRMEAGNASILFHKNPCTEAWRRGMVIDGAALNNHKSSLCVTLVFFGIE